MSERTPGFRLGVFDGVFLLLYGVAGWFYSAELPRLSGLATVVVVHFFLFCNVFRIRRSFELIWTGMYLLNVMIFMVTDSFSVFGVVLAQSPVTVILIALEMRSPRYHGVLHRRINRI